MCGVAGFIGTETISDDRVQVALHAMRNRGPDHKDWVEFHNENHHVYLLHSRLNIIDLHEQANQPFVLDNHVLLFNGEIYNYKELREQLPDTNWKTNSDTEVLLHYYLKYGENCVDHFEGMWAFAIYDKQTKRLLLSRDRFGEKPLYVWERPEGVYFASETRFLWAMAGHRSPVNYRHIFRYLVNGYKSLYKTDEEFYEDIRALPYASLATIGFDGLVRVSRYWEPGVCDVENMSMQEAVAGFREHLLLSIKLRLRADVPLAFCLSGGVDSGTIASIAAKEFNYDVATFSLIDRDERYNEYDNIKAVIDELQCQHTIINLESDGMLDRLKKLVAYHDCPVSTISYLIHSMLSEAISEQGFHVVCSGTGADELVTGYYDHFNLHLYEMREHQNFERWQADWERYIRPVVRNPYLQNPMLYFDNPSFRDHVYLNNDVFRRFLNTGFDEEFTEETYDGSILRNRMLNELFHESIPVILHEDDLNSMMYSVENRSPYLDRKLFEFACSIPHEHLVRDGYAKYVLREAVKGILPEQVRLDRRKKGFNASIHSIVDFDDAETRAWLLSDSSVFDLVIREKVSELFDHPRPFSNSESKFLFNFINVRMFLELVT